MKIISCKEAKALALKRYFTGKPCKRGHVSVASMLSTLNDSTLESCPRTRAISLDARYPRLPHARIQATSSKLKRDVVS
jgi:hypothetical protein